jgi:hypothetical protein
MCDTRCKSCYAATCRGRTSEAYGYFCPVLDLQLEGAAKATVSTGDNLDAALLQALFEAALGVDSLKPPAPAAVAAASDTAATAALDTTAAPAAAAAVAVTAAEDSSAVMDVDEPCSEQSQQQQQQQSEQQQQQEQQYTPCIVYARGADEPFSRAAATSAAAAATSGNLSRAALIRQALASLPAAAPLVFISGSSVAEPAAATAGAAATGDMAMLFGLGAPPAR